MGIGVSVITVRTNSTLVPYCQNCGAFVTEAYVAVFAPDGHDTVRACPHCEDLIRDGADVREARAPRS